MPNSLRNSFSSSILASTRRSLVSSRMEASRRPATPSFVGSWIAADTSGRASRNHCSRSPSSGYFLISSPSNVVAAHRGRRPTIDRTLRRWAWPSGKRRTS